MKVTIDGNERYIDGLLHKELMYLKGAVKNDWDAVLFIFGRERTGKSTFAGQIAKVLDDDFSVNQVAWTPKQFISLCMSSKKYQAVVLDEGYFSFANMRGGVQALTRTIISMLTTIGSKNLYLIVVCPTFFDLSYYLIVHRAVAAFRIYSHGQQRGFWSMYSEETKLQLYVKGRKDHNLTVVQPDRRGRFASWVPWDIEEYNRRKNEAIGELHKPQEDSNADDENYQRGYEDGKWETIAKLHKNHIFELGKLKKLLELEGGMPRQTFYSKIARLSDNSQRKKGIVPSVPPILLELKSEPEDDLLAE